MNRESARIAKKRSAKLRANPSDLLPGLNDISDLLEAFPIDVIRHFTLLREVEAKCTSTTSLLSTLIPQFLEMPVDDQSRDQMLLELRSVMTELLPCFEEKIHVAGSATDAVQRHMDRLDADFDRIAHCGELPDSVIYGPANHPALIGDKSAQDVRQTQTSTRSESRREAVAAKRAGQTVDDEPAKRKQVTDDGPSKRRKAEKKEDLELEIVRPGSPVRPSRPSTPLPVQTSQIRRSRVTARTNRRPPSASVPAAVNAPDAVSPVRDDQESEPVYCYCQQVSYGEMVACDGRDCKREWFHLPCVGLSAPPKGQWFCDECAAKLKKKVRA
ncbi:hypothetical protein V1512DRAFT_267500 [Lipomyces arxii]|uniref:uncharacterized protein n=1 Tax=Lipomyces arxii TaxID=56418 RepID=UPI0034CD76A7